MAVASVKVGQVWHRIETSDNWLVTKLYSEVFASYAVLRKVGGSDRDVHRVKVEKSAKGVTLPGFFFTAETESS